VKRIDLVTWMVNNRSLWSGSSDDSACVFVSVD